jgi:hypothetical protein
MVSSLLYVVANVELNRLHKKEKGETQYETPKPLLSKKKTQRLELLTRGRLLVPVGVINRD